MGVGLARFTGVGAGARSDGAVALADVGVRDGSVRAVIVGVAWPVPEAAGAESPITASVSCTGWSTAVVSAVDYYRQFNLEMAKGVNPSAPPP